MSVLTSIVAALANYLTSIWTVARMVFSILDTDLMINCIQLLSVCFLIGFIDNLPNMFKRKEKKRIPILDEDREEWVLVKRRARD